MPETFENLAQKYIKANTGSGSLAGQMMADDLGWDFKWAMVVKYGDQQDRDAFFEGLKTQLMNMGKKPEAKPPTLEATWWLFDREPGMDDMLERAQESLAPMFTKLGIQPFRTTTGVPRIFLARFEFPKWGKEFHFRSATKDLKQKPMLFIDFLGGFPLDCCEMLVVATELTTPASEVSVKDASDLPVVPPIPDSFFSWPDDTKILFNLTALAYNNCNWMAINLYGEPAPVNLHWWVRTFLGNSSSTPLTFPMPGEFVAMAVRIMPDKPWGGQASSPFFYSGNWFDTVYYTSGKITEVLDPVAPATYNTYKVHWRKTYDSEGGVVEADGIITASPIDFADYQVGDRVTILKDITTTKDSQLWKDKDMTQPGDEWRIAPITFYNDNTE